MNTTLALTIIGIVQILVGIIFNLIPKEVNKKINPDIPAEAEDIAATFRVIIGGISIAMGVIALSCREIPTAQAMVLLNGMGIAFIIIALGIISVKPRGFDKQIAFKWFVYLFAALSIYGLVVFNFGTAVRYKFPFIVIVIVGMAYELYLKHGKLILNKGSKQ